MARMAAGEPDVSKLSSGIQTNNNVKTRNLGELFREAKERNKKENPRLSKGKMGYGIYRLSKHRHKNYKNGFGWRYRFESKNKTYDFASTDILKLKTKVKLKNLMWKVYDEELARKTAKQAGVEYDQLI